MATSTHRPENIQLSPPISAPSPRRYGTSLERRTSRACRQKSSPPRTAVFCLQPAFNICVCCHIGAPGIATIAAIHSVAAARTTEEAQPAGRKWERVMFDPLSKADRYRTVAAEFANLAKSASSDFSRGYYQRVAERYQSLAEGGSDLPHDEAAPSLSPAASPPPSAIEPKPADANDRGFVQVMIKVARRVSLLPSRREN